MERKNFVKIMNEARNYYDKCNLLMDAFNVENGENFMTEFLSSVIDFLDAQMTEELPAEWEWIVNDYAWSFNFGRNGDFIIHVNGEDHRIIEPGELYDVLMEIKKLEG